MAYPGRFLRLAVSGSLFTSEQFAFTCSLVPNFPTDNDGPDTVPAGVVSAIQTFWQSTDAKMPSHAKLLTIKLNEIGTDGRYTKDTTVFHDFTPPGVAGASTPTQPLPAQCSLAVSLVTGRSRGLASKGRFFLPAPVAPLDADGRLAAAIVTGIQTAAITMLNGINAAMATADGGGGGAFRVGVASDTREGKFEVATGVRVGRTIDTIRSRRTAIAEMYPASGTLAEPA